MLLREILFEKLFATPVGTQFDLRNTLFFKILRANPLLARFYADLFRRHGANPSLIKDFRNSIRKIFRSRSITQQPNQQTLERSKHGSQSQHSVLFPHQG
jgi:hypothetical protein